MDSLVKNVIVINDSNHIRADTTKKDKKISSLINLIYQNDCVKDSVIKISLGKKNFLNHLYKLSKIENVIVKMRCSDTIIAISEHCIYYLNHNHKMLDFKFTESKSANKFISNFRNNYELIVHESHQNLCYKNGFFLVRNQNHVYFIFIQEREFNEGLFRKTSDYLIQNFSRKNFLISRGGGFIPDW